MNNIEVISRVVIVKKGKILLCRAKGKSWYYFPGGHVEFGESADFALARELKEELGAKISGIKFIGSTENIFNQDKKNHQEINLIFQAKIEGAPDKSLEDHIEFYWVDLKAFKRENIMPVLMKKSVINWLKNKKIFWISENNLKSK